METDDDPITPPPSRAAPSMSRSRTPVHRPGVTINLPASKGGSKSRQMKNKVTARQPPPSPDPPAGKGKGRASPDPQSYDETLQLPAIGTASAMLPNFEGADDDEYLDTYI